MVSKKYELVWDNEAKDYLKKSIQYIRLDSPQNASKISKELKVALDDLIDHPERYPPDKYRLNNNNNQYRAFNFYNFRISYFINDEVIRIVRVRHSKQDALFY